jgi:hypothetical protein
LSQFTQVVSVRPVRPYKLDGNTNESAPEILPGVYTGAVRIRVKVQYRLNPADAPVELYSTSWIRVDD